MDIIIKCVTHTNNDDYSEKMIVDGKEILSIHSLSECPEDAIIGRDLISCYEIKEYMKLAYEAGKNGEDFNVEVINIKK